MNYLASVYQTMARTGKSFRKVCQEKGAAGGRKAAANKRRARAMLEERHIEKLRQVAMGTESPDAVPVNFTPQDRANITREGQQARLRVERLSAHRSSVHETSAATAR